jgi:phosphate transport system substrate-binding protein
MLHKKDSSLVTFALLLALASAPKSIMTSQLMQPVVAQSPVPTLPVPQGTRVRIDGSESMEAINQNLKQRFEQQYPNTQVEIEKTGTDPALKALQDGNIDLAAIGRPLTEGEKAQGLVPVTVHRQKIAMIVSPNNPFTGDLTFEQFAKMFRGEIKNWSEVGGPPSQIRFIDRPETSDTRKAFQIYPVFQNAPFKTGDNAVKLTEDNTDALAKELGKDGIGYAIADQVKDRKDIRIVSMNKTLPSDPRYPFSQPLTYVYKGPNPNAAVKGFLCYANTSSYATTSDEKEIVSASFCSEEVAPGPTGGLPAWLWWLLPLALLAGLLAWLLGKRPGESELAATAIPPVAPPTVPSIPESRIILTPRNCKEAYAYWEVADERKAELKRQGGEKMGLRVYEVTDMDMDNVPAHSIQQFECNERDCDRHVPIPVDDRDYVAELGYSTRDGRWLSLIRSLHVRVPACPPEPVVIPSEGPAVVAASPANLLPIEETPSNPWEDIVKTGTTAIAGVGATAAGIGMAAQSFISDKRSEEEKISRIILVPSNAREAYAYWEVSEAEKEALKQQGGQQFALRVYEVTGMDMDEVPAHNVRQFDLNEGDRDRHVPIHVSDRDYIAEIGYTTAEGRWLSLVRSLHVRVPAV